MMLFPIASSRHTPHAIASFRHAPHVPSSPVPGTKDMNLFAGRDRDVVKSLVSRGQHQISQVPYLNTVRGSFLQPCFLGVVRVCLIRRTLFWGGTLDT